MDYHDDRWIFHQDEIAETESDLKSYRPYICPDCQNKTMLDRGKRFQCQLCMCEYEYEHHGAFNRDSFEQWRSKVRRQLMDVIK